VGDRIIAEFTVAVMPPTVGFIVGGYGAGLRENRSNLLNGFAR
jgi:hypothetical protein